MTSQPALVPFTKHGKRRFRQRMKLPARALRRMAQAAYFDGQCPEDLPSAARHKILSQQARLDPNHEAVVRVYRDFIFIFEAETRALITLYPLNVPDEYMHEG